MSLAEEYRRQAAWRPWPHLFDALPPLNGQTVLDLGCSIGDQAAGLAARGARVVGVDSNEELLRAASGARIPNTDFMQGDLRSLPDFGSPADGIWCSFAAGYFTDLSPVLRSWRDRLRPGGWIALTEVDDLFGHEPLGPRARSLFEAYAAEALAAGRFDFHMGAKLRSHLESSGFSVTRDFSVGDQELSFSGPARADVLEAWRSRFDRMRLLREFCGAEFEPVREEFLSCLASAGHRSLATVRCCMATRQA